MNHPFEIAGGSITGHAHVAAGRNNQDAFSWATNDAGLVAVVCDGCGSGAHSEVGAQVGARLITQAAARRLHDAKDISTVLEDVRQEVLAGLRTLGAAMSAEAPSSRESQFARNFARTVSDYFLFTAVGVIVTADHATVFALGDGLVVVNGDRQRLGPYPNNQPPYLGYALLPEGAGPRDLETFTFQVLRSLPLGELRSLLLGTDGTADLDDLSGHLVHGREDRVGPLSGFWTDDRFFRNADMVRRRFTVLSRGPHRGLLADDTTLVVLRRKGTEP